MLSVQLTRSAKPLFRGAAFRAVSLVREAGEQQTRAAAFGLAGADSLGLTALELAKQLLELTVPT